VIFPNDWLAIQWFWPVTLMIGFTALVSIICYALTSSNYLRWVMVTLRIAALLLLGLCLLEPQSRSTRPAPGANLFVVIADDSQSLQIKDPGQTLTREDQLRLRLAADQPWLQRLGQDFELRKFVSNKRLRPVSDFAQFKADQRGSNLISNLQLATNRTTGKPIAGVLLLSDGNATDARLLESVLRSSSESGQNLPPIYPVIIGNDSAPKDIAITSISSSQTHFESAPVTITANLMTNGFAGQSVVVKLLDASGKEIDQQQISKVEDGKSFSVRFKARPTQPGLSAYQVNVLPWNEAGNVDSPTLSAEATLVNNSRMVVVDRGRGPFRVLYVSGRPNWDLKYMRRALFTDDEIDLVALVRIAKREAKFTFRGRDGQDSNSLFRGFKNQEDDTTERFDEPVLLRLGTKDDKELQGGFPKDPEILFQYDAVVLDDVESDFFSPDQQAMLQKFVSWRGGGLMMLGGQESFSAGDYDRTPIGTMLPVYLDRMILPTQQTYRLNLTRDGWLQPWVRLETTEVQETKRIQKMPTFVTINAAKSIKPGATVLSTVQGEDGLDHPAMVVQAFGKGRTSALLIGDLWRWHLKTPLENEDLLKSWRQTLRWLVTDTPGQVEFLAEKDPNNPQSVRLVIDVRDDQYKPLDNAKLSLEVETPSGDRIPISCQASDVTTGRYETTFFSDTPGVYKAKVSATADDGSEIQERQIGWVCEPETEEFASLVPNRMLMDTLARRTGGEVVSLQDIDSLVADLPNRKVPITIEEVFPWWHRWTLFSIVIGLLVAEWGMRRWKGLP